jgi:hypothetical protein
MLLMVEADCCETGKVGMRTRDPMVLCLMDKRMGTASSLISRLVALGLRLQ